MGSSVPTVLLNYDDPAMRDLVAEVLGEAGYHVLVLPPGADLVAYAAQAKPGVIVSDVSPVTPGTLTALDRLRVDPATRAIPVVAISTSVVTAGEAQAGPNVPDTLVAPFDLAELEEAVASALQTPPPPAVLPPATRPAPPHVRLASDALISQARLLAIRAIHALERQEPYRTRFRGLSPDLVDHIGQIFGGIVTGLQRMLPPSDVFAVPEIRRAIHEHVTLRIDQGLGPSAAIQEYQLLRNEVDQFLQTLVGRPGFDGADAVDLSRRLAPYFEQVIRIVASEYRERVSPTPEAPAPASVPGGQSPADAEGSGPVDGENSRP